MTASFHCTSCIVGSFRSRKSFISSPLWTLSLRSDVIISIKILSLGQFVLHLDKAPRHLVKDKVIVTLTLTLSLRNQ